MLDQPYKIYRKIGRSLAAHVIAKPDLCRNSAVLAALVSDLAESSFDQVAPIRDLICRPGFQKLIPLVRSNSGALYRDALASELRPIYSESVIRGLTELLNEFLDLADSTIAEPDKILHRANNHLPQVGLEARPSGNGAPSAGVLGSYLIKVGLLLSGFVLVATIIKSPLLCSFVRLCFNEVVSDPRPKEDPLARAQKSARNVRAAKDRDEMEKALYQLDSDLRLINPNTLTQEKLFILNELTNLAADQRFPAAHNSAVRERLQPEAPSKHNAVAIPEPVLTDPITKMPQADFEPARPEQRSQAVRQSQPQSKRSNPQIQRQLAPLTRQELDSSAPAPPSKNAETQGQKQYSLPPAWEERRAKRRDIMNHYSGDGGQQ